jgi:NADH-quinone oxidoreductase subunit L
MLVSPPRAQMRRLPLPQRWPQLQLLVPTPWWPGLALFALAVLLWVLGAFAGFSLVRQAGAAAMLGAAVLALLGGYITIPVEKVFPMVHEEHPDLLHQAIMIGLPMLGILVAYLVFVKGIIDTKKLAGSGLGAALHRFWFTQWGMDWLYDRLFVFPYVGIAKLNKSDFIDAIYNGIAKLTLVLHGLVSDTQTGQLRWYALTMISGALLLVSIGVFL